MLGGAGADKFVFAIGFGKDVIKDFSVSEGDRIKLADVSAIKGWSDLKTNHMENSGDDVLITAGKTRF